MRRFVMMLAATAAIVVLAPGWVLVSAQPPAGSVRDRPAAPPVVDGIVYPDDAAARTAWKPMKGTAEVSLVQMEGRPALKMPCNFKGTDIDRASWDRSVRLDLTAARGLQFDFYCPDLGPVGRFSLYLRSGNGWYAADFSAGTKFGWTTVRIDKDDTAIEEAPAGWAAIDAIRISAWRGGDVDAVFYLRNVRVFGGDESILLVRGESAATAAKNELASVCQFTSAVSVRLDELGLGYCLVSDLDLTAERVKGRKLVILPHNPQMPARAVGVLDQYLRDGGKMLAFYTLPAGLQAAAGVTGGDHLPAKKPGQFSSVRPTADTPVANLPAQTGQNSWNINNAKVVEGRSRVAAEWYDQAGQPTGLPALLASDNCILMTHVLLGDDAANKRRMLMALAGYLAPDLWQAAASGTLAQLGRVGSFKDWQDASDYIGREAEVGSTAPAALQKATALRTAAGEHFQAHRFREALEAAEQAAAALREAICLVQKPQRGEEHLFWCHSPFGVEGMDWDQAVANLADNGFTAVLPNMLRAGVAYYDSQVLPVAPEVKTRGDQLAACLAACRKYGVACHVWKVCWNMSGLAPRDFVQQMKTQGRMQIGFDGKPIDQWLCPSNPDNQKLEIDSMVEVATKYDVDGVHFDYIRYPGPEGCFCAGCRARFEKLLGAKVGKWPGDVRSDPALRAKWLDFRRDNITAVVAGVSEALRKNKPKVKISAAVFANWPVDRDGVGQDWKLWCEKGYLDFVCPMDYTPYTGQFHDWAARQMRWAGNVPCYPGIGLSVWSDPTDVYRLLEQINAARQAGAKGFTIFNYAAAEAREIVPLCGMGITRKP